MLSRSEKSRLKMLISDTVLLLCKNGLMPKLKGQFCIEGLIGITLEEDDLLLVSFNEKLKGALEEETDSQSGSESEQEIKPRKRKRKHKRSVASEENATPKKSASIDSYTAAASTASVTTTCDKSNSDKSNIVSSSTPQTSTDKSRSLTNIIKTTPLGAKQNRQDSLQRSEVVLEEVESDREGNVNSSFDFGENSVTGHSADASHGGSVSVKLEGYDNDSDEDLVMIKQEIASPSSSSFTSVTKVEGSFQEGTQITGIIPNQQVFPSSRGRRSSTQTPVVTAPQEEVELIPGTNVYISSIAFQQLKFIDKGTKLVRKLVREVFPDVHMLANSSCKGKGTSGGLDQHKVDVIKAFTCSYCQDMSESKVCDIIGQICREYRYQSKKKDKQGVDSSMDSSLLL